MRINRLGRLSNESLAEQAREQIRQAIIDGLFGSEERLTIEGLAAELGTSRTPVREALKALEADGLVQLLPRRGAVVSRFTAEEIRDRYRVRGMLEAYAGELACRTHGRKLVPQLDAINSDLEREMQAGLPLDRERVRRLVEINATFHRLISRASGSSTLLRLLETLPAARQLEYWRLPHCQSRSLELHRRVAEAFRQERPLQVRRWLQRHIVEAGNFLISLGPSS